MTNKQRLIILYEISGYLELADMAKSYKSYENASKMINLAIDKSILIDFENKQNFLEDLYGRLDELHNEI